MRVGKTVSEGGKREIKKKKGEMGDNCILRQFR